MANSWIGLFAIPALLAWMLFTWRGGLLLVREIRRSLQGGYLVDGLAILAGVSANLLNIGYELGCRIWHWPNYNLNIPVPARLLGLALFALGFAFAIWARRIMGSAWTVLPGGARGRLLTEGPYGMVRHPIYAGAVLVYGGLILVQNNLTGNVIFGAQMIGFLTKTVLEDRSLGLREALDYQDYKRRVRWRLFPGLW